MVSELEKNKIVSKYNIKDDEKRKIFVESILNDNKDIVSINEDLELSDEVLNLLFKSESVLDLSLNLKKI